MYIYISLCHRIKWHIFCSLQRRCHGHFAWVPVLSLHFYLYQYCFKERHGRLLAVLLVLLSRGNGWGWNIVRGEPSWHACDQYIKYYFKNHSIHHCCHEMPSHQILLWRFFCLHTYVHNYPPFLLYQYILSFLEEKLQMNLKWQSPQ